jgi:hypothetical protein
MTADLTPGQVEYFVSQATSLGIPAREVPELWERHMTWCDENGRTEYGGRTWLKFLEPIAREWKERVVLSAKDAARAEQISHQRQLDRRTKEAAERAYEAEAVTLSTWLASLRSQLDNGDALVPLERILAMAVPPGPKDDPGEWLQATVGLLPKQPRAHECGYPDCGLPTERWVGNGLVYRSGRCCEHAALELDAWRQRRQTQQKAKAAA